MRKVIWDTLQSNKDTKDDCHAVLHDAIVDVLDIESPTDEQIKKLYDCIPMITIHSGVFYGFGNTLVREELHEFIRDNLEQVKELMK